MKKLFAIITLVIGSVTAAGATTVDVASLEVSYVNVNALFLGGGETLNVTTTENLLSGYLPIVIAGNRFIYTAAENVNPNGMGPVAGSITGGPVPTATIDLGTNILTADMTSLFANVGNTDQNVGGIATGFVDPVSGEFQMSWTTVLTQGPGAGRFMTFTFGGYASAVPVPASLLLFGSGLIGLAGIARRKAA